MDRHCWGLIKSFRGPSGLTGLYVPTITASIQITALSGTLTLITSVFRKGRGTALVFVTLGRKSGCLPWTGFMS